MSLNKRKMFSLFNFKRARYKSKFLELYLLTLYTCMLFHVKWNPYLYIRQTLVFYVSSCLPFFPVQASLNTNSDVYLPFQGSNFLSRWSTLLFYSREHSYLRDPPCLEDFSVARAEVTRCDSSARTSVTRDDAVFQPMICK